MNLPWAPFVAETKQFLNQTFRFFNVHFLPLSKVLLIFFIPSFIFSEYFSLDSQLLIDLSETATGPIYYTAVCLVWLGFVFLVFLYLLVVWQTILQLERKQYAGVLNIYQNAFEQFFSFITLTLQYFFTVCLHLFLLIVPGLRKFIYYSFYPLIFIVEGKTGTKAFERSQALIQPQWKRHLKHLFLLTIIVIGYSLPLFIALDALMGFMYMKYWLVGVAVINHMQLFFIIYIGVIPCHYYYLYYQTCQGER